MAITPSMRPGRNGGLLRNGNPDNKGGHGAIAHKVKLAALQKMAGETGQSYDEILDGIAQNTEYTPFERIAAVKTQKEIADLQNAPSAVLENEAVFQHATPLINARISQRYDELMQGASVEDLKALILSDLVECWVEGSRLAEAEG